MTTAPEQNLVPIFVDGWRCVRRISLALFGEQRFRIVNVKDLLISAADPLGQRLYQQRAL